MGDAADPRDGRRTFIVPAIKPFDHYDFSRAKIACNLAWLVAKAFGTGRRWPPRASLPRSCAHPGFVSVLWSPPPPRLARRTGSGTRWAMRGGEGGGGNAGLLFGQEPLVWAGGMRQIFYWTAEVDVCCFLCHPPPPVTNFVTFLHGVVFICGVFLIVLRSFPPQS